MDQNSTDLVMQFVYQGKPLLAECALQIPKNDTLMDGFVSADYDNYSNFFEVKDFNFKLGLNDDDKSSNTFGNHARQPAGAAEPAATESFSRWRSASNSEYKSIFYALKSRQNFSFTRIIDRASMIFFQNCCTSQTFDRAVLVKRLSQGGSAPSGDTRPSVGYLRIIFSEVMITSIDWSDGDLVEEKCDCTCKAMRITYRKQKDDGTIDGSGVGETSAVWPNPNNDRSLGIRFRGGRG